MVYYLSFGNLWENVCTQQPVFPTWICQSRGIKLPSTEALNGKCKKCLLVVKKSAKNLKENVLFFKKKKDLFCILFKTCIFAGTNNKYQIINVTKVTLIKKLQ